ncbi:MAG: hypothetical protein ACREBG_24540 [Pyrinomonadaceae bacterium]
MQRLFKPALFFVTILLFAVSSFSQSISREDLRKEIEAKRTELQALENRFLAPSKEDRTANAEFLKEPNTGLIRLLPRELYDVEVYDKTRKSLTIRGGGAYYSFTRLTHEYGSGSDIQLEAGHLSVGFAGANYGILTKLVDVSLEEVSLQHPIVSFLAEYKAAAVEPDARIEQRRFSGGTTIDGVLYQRRLPVETQATYVLRSIDYATSDVLVAFRVVRKDTDGSVIIAWKLLQKYPVPELARNN